MNVMRSGTRVLLSAAAGVLLWAFISWPLPKFFSKGIPAAAHPFESDAQVMTPGDHLQFLYHCWLLGDMIAGRTPFFYNLYEFNTGNDAERFHLDSYYVPFSLVYALGSAIGGRAFGWNLMGLISIWLTFLFTWLLARRYTSNEFVAALSAVVAVALPYRWITLLGGSPTGLAMMWAPIIWLGTDMAARENRVEGGFLAGLGILFASWTDLHVLFFSALAIPLWCVMALIGRTRWDGERRGIFLKLFTALLPVAVIAAPAIFFPNITKWIETVKTGLAPAADMVGERSLNEVALYSPGWQGFFSWRLGGEWGEIYVGWFIISIIAAGLPALLLLMRKGFEAKWRHALVMLLLIAGIIAIGLLALGVNGPADAVPLRLCRKLIPPYGMIRQPAKIFCLMPSFLAVSLAVALSAIVESLGKTWKILVPMLCVVAIGVEYSLRIYPHICILENEQAAYAAVPECEGAKRAIVVPLWPGDSHYASVYQYFASLYRVRLVNGYAPFIKRDYIDNVFLRFQSMNIGELSDEQLDGLMDMRVSTIIVHEDLFPEKLSPFPVTFTLRELLNHPRLELETQDGPVWAFRILQSGSEKKDAAQWHMFGSARRWEEESCAARNAEVIRDAAAGRGAFLRLAGPGARLSTPSEDLGRAPDMKWMIRARGDGSLLVSQSVGEQDSAPAPLPVQAPDWEWLVVPVGNLAGFSSVSLDIECGDGIVDIDMIVLAAGRWEAPAPNEVLEVPAPAFFHAGYINMERNSVVFEKDRHANVVMFYGPKLPLEKGEYEIEIRFRSPANPGTPLGWFNIRRRHDDPETRNEVIAGRRAVARLNHTANLPVSVEFVFMRNADMEIDSVIFRRLRTKE